MKKPPKTGRRERGLLLVGGRDVDLDELFDLFLFVSHSIRQTLLILLEANLYHIPHLTASFGRVQ